MKIHIPVLKEFGSFCADGEVATSFRQHNVDPYLPDVDEIIFDFTGVRNMNSSFCNALIANIVRRDPATMLRKLRFLRCRANVRAVIELALDLGSETLASSQ